MPPLMVGVMPKVSQILVMLMRLRQICVHPCLLKVYEDAFEGKHDTRVFARIFG